MRTYTSVSDCHFNKFPPTNKIYVLNVTKNVLKTPLRFVHLECWSGSEAENNYSFV